MTIPNTDSSSSGWYHEPFGCDLPTGALTLLELGVGGTCSHLPTVLYQLVHDMVRQGRPVVVVDSDWAEEPDGAFMSQMITSPRLLAHADNDVSVPTPFQMASACDPPPFGRELSYDCLVPTLPGVGQVVALHEQTFGPSLLLFPDVAAARPYLHFESPGIFAGMTPSWLPDLPDGAISRWRATDFADAALGRPRAPTVVVWIYCADDPPGLVELRAVSALQIQSSWPGGDADLLYRVAERLPGREPREWLRTAPIWNPTETTAEALEPEDPHSTPNPLQEPPS